MKKFIFFVLTALVLAACSESEEQLKQRAFELCAYIPDHELLETSRDYMTEDFYNVLDTLFYRLPEFEAMDHEWLYYFVTGNGGTIADYEVKEVQLIDKTHAVATILVRQKWEDGSFDETTDIEEHQLYMERIKGKWLMSDFDAHKADCIRHIAISRQEQALRDTISAYLVREIGSQYLQGEICIPTLLMVAEEDSCVYGDFWIWWYKLSGDTLKCVSGGNHAGKITLRDGEVVAFEQTEDGARNIRSAKRIFGDRYDIYSTMHSNAEVREAVRREQLGEFVRRNKLSVRYYQDYGWPALPIEKSAWARGCDISWLSEMERDSVQFQDADHAPKECIALLRAHGMNAVRLRVWVNHKTGWSNLPDMISLARRAAEQGQRLMIDIHYSDFFADPSHQAIPEAWKEYDYPAMKEAVRNHTLEVLNALKEAGIRPEWVQVGNETPNGMLWPMGEVKKEKGNWAQYAGFTAAGYDAAKEVFPDITVIVHIDNAYERRDWFWSNLAAHGGKWDMIGLSHYPMMSAWNGGKSWQEMNELAETNIRRLIQDWHCPVMITEVGTYADDAASAEVMADFIHRITAIDFCAGIFYWEPQVFGGWRPQEYIPLGWGSYGMGAFTEEGCPNEALNTMLSSTPLGF